VIDLLKRLRGEYKIGLLSNLEDAGVEVIKNKDSRKISMKLFILVRLVLLNQMKRSIR